MRNKAAKLFELEDIVPNKEHELVNVEIEHKKVARDADRENSKLHNLRFVDLHIFLNLKEDK